MRIDTPKEAEYFRHGGILQYVLRSLIGVVAAARRLAARSGRRASSNSPAAAQDRAARPDICLYGSARRVAAHTRADMSGVTEHAPAAGSGRRLRPARTDPAGLAEPRAPRFMTDVVLELGLASEDDVQAAVDAARAAGGQAETVLVRTGVLDEDGLAVALAERFGLDRVDLSAFPVDAAAAERVTVETGLRYDALPVAVLPGGRLLVAVADPAGPGVAAVAAATARRSWPRSRRAGCCGGRSRRRRAG